MPHKVTRKKKRTGRPSGYKPQYCKMLLDYFNVEPTKEKKAIVLTKSGELREETVLEANDWPTMAGFACSIDVHRETLLNWSNEHPEFFDAIKKAKEHQERILITNAMRGLYAPSFSIFAAKNVLNWKDRQDVTSDDKQLNFTVVRGEDP